MHYILPIILAILGFFVGGLGLVAGADPEGRGGNLRHLMLVGLVMFAIAVVWLLYLGYVDIRALLYFNQ